ncbi:MAG: thiamine-phosphate pyrophosphorylase [Candidatus Omnitrophica bacterium]|nr:thiamine-phosphate pyrophosphorylase [Candidatus Omnitrophota bacterium]
MIDANFNRAKEGLRVCEDICRFVMNRGELARNFRGIRHDLLKILLSLPFPYDKIAASRDVEGDSGRKAFLRARLSGVKDVFLRNIKRSEEACRVLEEFSGLMHPASSRRFQALRFKIYALEKKTLNRL